MGNNSTTAFSEMSPKRIGVPNADLEITFSKKPISAPLETWPLPPVPVPVPPAGLLRLPFEIRLQIYHYCIPRKRIIDVSDPVFYIGWPWQEVDRSLDLGDETTLGLEDEDDDAAPLGDVVAVDLEDGNGAVDSGDYTRNLRNQNRNSIFLLSKQISEEALDVLYGDNVFQLYLHGKGEYYLRKNFTEANRRRIRYLLFAAQPRGISYGPGRMPDDALWSSLLPTLRGLRIVAEQPVGYSLSFNGPKLERDMDRWVKWIKPFLQCFGRHLSRETIVQVDIDRRAETRKLVKECMPHRYREIRCRHVGDLIFKRGRFSWESGYWDPRDCDGD